MDAPRRGRHVAEAPTDAIPVVKIGKHAPVPGDSGRRAAENPENPANTGPILAPISRARLVARFAAATAAVGMVGTAGYAASMPHSQPVGLDRPVEPVQTSQLPVQAPKHRLKEPKVAVRALPKPKAKPKPVGKPRPALPPAVTVVPAPAPVPIIPVPAPQPVAPPARIVPPAQPAPVAPPKVVPTLPKPPVQPPAAPVGAKAPQIAAAALAQLGRTQDCTALVTNAIATVGINFHGWPAGYLSLGPTVTALEAIPGDLVYYQNGGMGVAHIGVFIGNGQAVHGGWNGSNTEIASVNVGSGPVYIRVL